MWECSGSPRSSTRGWARPQDPALAQACHGMGGEAQAPQAHKEGWRPPARGASAHPPAPHLPLLRQISNYLTVPAHKLDSPTMSRPASAQVRQAGGPCEEPEAGHGPQRACEDGLSRAKP